MSQNNAVLNQLRALRVEIKQPQQMAQPVQQPQPVAQPRQEEVKVEKAVEQQKPVLTEEYSYEESLILDKPINTIE